MWRKVDPQELESSQPQHFEWICALNDSFESMGIEAKKTEVEIARGGARLFAKSHFKKRGWDSDTKLVIMSIGSSDKQEGYSLHPGVQVLPHHSTILLSGGGDIPRIRKPRTRRFLDAILDRQRQIWVLVAQVNWDWRELKQLRFDELSKAQIIYDLLRHKIVPARDIPEIVKYLEEEVSQGHGMAVYSGMAKRINERLAPDARIKALKSLPVYLKRHGKLKS